MMRKPNFCDLWKKVGIIFIAGILALNTLNSISNAKQSEALDRASGEDFPFFTCYVEDISLKKFKIIESETSMTGYAVRHQNAVGLWGEIDVSISEIEGSIQIEGFKRRFAGVNDKYFFAEINTEAPRNSKSLYLRSTIGIPTNDSRIKSASCFLM